MFCSEPIVLIRLRILLNETISVLPLRLMTYISSSNIEKLLDNQTRIFHKNIFDPTFSEINYQNTLLEKVYKTDSILSSIEYLNLEYMIYGRNSFVSSLQFIYEHDFNALKGIQKPTINHDTNTLLLNNNSLLLRNQLE